MERLVLAAALLAFFVGLPVALGALSDDAIANLTLISVPVVFVGWLVWMARGIVRG